MNVFTLIVIIVAFAIGYKVIGWLMDRLRLSRTSLEAPEPTQDGGAAPGLGDPRSVSWPTGPATPTAREEARGHTYEDPETRYARILGLPRAYTSSEITIRHRTLIAQYHPDKVRHLGPDLQEVARRKTGEIAEAYEYFRVKYNLR